MAGNEVNRSVIDIRTGEAVLSLRAAFDRVENVAKFLANNPSDGANDPLITTFGYTADEAYVIRLVFQSFESIRISNANTFDIARKLTGLD